MNIHCQCVMKYQVLISCPTLEDYNFGCANIWAIYIYKNCYEHTNQVSSPLFNGWKKR